MEVAGVVFRQAPCLSSNTGDASKFRNLHSFPTMKQCRSFSPKQQLNRSSLEFSDKSHLQYYNGPRMAVKEKETESKKKEMKKKLKLLKGLSKNLSTFSEMGFGLNPDNGLDHQVKGQMISEATDVLLSQLQKLKAEELEYKMKKKEEKAKKKAARMMTNCKDSSSSESSSSSSESECENVVKASQLKSIATPNVNTEATSPVTPPAIENTGTENTISVCCSSNSNSVDGSNVELSIDSVGSKKIEVCMGGKCKKSGGALLLENFQKAVGGEAAVVGCKCMGKCRDGPNVRVRSEDAVANPLCIGVGLEDVDLIVSNFFGGTQRSDIMLPALSGV